MGPAMGKSPAEHTSPELNFTREVESPAAIGKSLEGLQRVGSLVQAMKEFSHPGNKQKSPEDLNAIAKEVGRARGRGWLSVVTSLSKSPKDS
jgi:hypothetical protein